MPSRSRSPGSAWTRRTRRGRSRVMLDHDTVASPGRGDAVGSAVTLARRAAAGGLLVWALARTRRSGLLRFARMGGSSIAGPSAAGWVTDFLNAAYYRR